MRVFKKLITISITTIGLACTFTIAKPQKVSAAPWGARELFTTPKATRGTWYYKSGHKTRKCIITAHTADGRKLYKELPEKQYIEWWRKLEKYSSYKTINYLDHNIWQAYTFKWHGITSFNTNGWLAGAGDGIYYVPVTKYHNGKKVKALRFGGGARNWLWFYAYKKTQNKIAKKNIKTNKDLNNLTSVSQNGNSTTLSAKDFSIRLDNDSAYLKNNKLNIDFDFTNSKHKMVYTNEINNDVKNSIAVYQGKQYLNFRIDDRWLGGLPAKVTQTLTIESDQLQNVTAPIKVIFSNPKNGKQLKIVRINLSKTQTDQNDSF